MSATATAAVATVNVHAGMNAPSISSVKQKIKTAYITFVDAVLPSSGFWAFTSLASSVNRVAGIVFSGIKAGSDVAGGIFKEISEGIGLVYLLSNVKYWISGDYSKTEKFISEIILGVRSVANGILYFANRGAFSLARIAINIGQLPVFSLVTGGLLAIGTVFTAADTYKDYKKISNDLDVMIAFDSSSDQIVKFREGIKANRIRMNIMKFDVVRNVAGIAFQVFLILGMATGWGALAATGAFLLTYSIVTSTAWLYSCYLKQKHTKVEATSLQKILS